MNVTCLMTEDQLVLTLMKLRHDFSFIYLAECFTVSETTVDSVFYTWL